MVGQADGSVVPVIYAAPCDICRCYFLYRGPTIESEPGPAAAAAAAAATTITTPTIQYTFSVPKQ